MLIDMDLKIRISFVLALMLLLGFAAPVLAGGWAVITLDELPSGVMAGEPLRIGFMVLQHGRTPLVDIQPTVTARSLFEETITVQAVPEGKPGHYAAMITFPKEGNWEWSIQAFTMDQPMPKLSVAAPVVGTVSQPMAKTVPESGAISPLVIVRVAALGIGLFGLAFAFRRKSRVAVALAVSCLLVGLGSFVTGSTVPAVEAESKSSTEAVRESSVSQVEFGRQIFVAKGCITCHVNNRIPNSNDYQTIEMGAPDLSKFSASPEVLRLRLTDPTLVKSDTQMPNLNLSDAEIEALIAFINSK